MRLQNASRLILPERTFAEWHLCRRISLDRDFQRSLRGDRATTDLGDATEDGGIEIACAAFVANADRHIFQDDKCSLVPKRLTIDSPVADSAVTVFAGKTIHAAHLTGFRKP